MISSNASEGDCALAPAGSFLPAPGVRRSGRRAIHADEIIATVRSVSFDRRHLAMRRYPGRGPGTSGRADAFRTLALDRRQALWAIRGLSNTRLPLFDSYRHRRWMGAASTRPAATNPDGKDC